MHQAHHGGGLEAGAEAFQGTGQGGGGEEAGGFVDAPVHRIVGQGAGDGHGQAGVLVHEGGYKGAPDHVGGQVGHLVATQTGAFAHQVHIHPVRGGFHGGDEVHQFLRRIRDCVESFVAGFLEHADQVAEAVFGHQRGVGIGHGVAQQGVGAGALHFLIVGEDLLAVLVGEMARQGAADVHGIGETLRGDIEIDIAIERGNPGFLCADFFPECVQ